MSCYPRGRGGGGGGRHGSGFGPGRGRGPPSGEFRGRGGGAMRGGRPGGHSGWAPQGNGHGNGPPGVRPARPSQPPGPSEFSGPNNGPHGGHPQQGHGPGGGNWRGGGQSGGTGGMGAGGIAAGPGMNEGVVQGAMQRVQRRLPEVMTDGDRPAQCSVGVDEMVSATAGGAAYAIAGVFVHPAAKNVVVINQNTLRIYELVMFPGAPDAQHRVAGPGGCVVQLDSTGANGEQAPCDPPLSLAEAMRLWRARCGGVLGSKIADDPLGTARGKACGCHATRLGLLDRASWCDAWCGSSALTWSCKGCVDYSLRRSFAVNCHVEHRTCRIADSCHVFLFRCVAYCT